MKKKTQMRGESDKKSLICSIDLWWLCKLCPISTISSTLYEYLSTLPPYHHTRNLYPLSSLLHCTEDFFFLHFKFYAVHFMWVSHILFFVHPQHLIIRHNSPIVKFPFIISMTPTTGMIFFQHPWNSFPFHLTRLRFVNSCSQLSFYSAYCVRGGELQNLSESWVCIFAFGTRICYLDYKITEAQENEGQLWE